MRIAGENVSLSQEGLQIAAWIAAPLGRSPTTETAHGMWVSWCLAHCAGKLSTEAFRSDERDIEESKRRVRGEDFMGNIEKISLSSGRGANKDARLDKEFASSADSSASVLLCARNSSCFQCCRWLQLASWI